MRGLLILSPVFPITDTCMFFHSFVQQGFLKGLHCVRCCLEARDIVVSSIARYLSSGADILVGWWGTVTRKQRTRQFQMLISIWKTKRVHVVRMIIQGWGSLDRTAREILSEMMHLR